MIKNRTTLALGVALAALSACLAYSIISYGLLKLRAHWAEEQIETFHSMLQNAQDAGLDDTVACLEYTVRYYPSGTKQLVGTPLDRAVERVRADVVARIMDRLRFITGKDLGNNPEVWISAWREEPRRTL